MSDDPQLAARLLRLERYHTTHFETGRTGFRVFLAHSLLMFALLFLAVGDVSFEQQFSFAGITLTIGAAFFMVVAALLLAVLVFYEVALSVHQEKVRRVIAQEYAALGLPPNGAVYDGGESLFAFPSFGQAIVSVMDSTMLTPMLASLPKVIQTKRSRGFVTKAVLALATALVGSALLYILPAVTEWMAISYAVQHQGWNWLIVLATVCIVILNLATWLATPAMLSKSPREAVRTSMNQGLDAVIAAGVELPPELLAALGRMPTQAPNTADAPEAPAPETVSATALQPDNEKVLHN